MSNIVTIFKNIKETEAPFHKDVLLILDRIKNGSSAELVKSIRTEKDKSKRNDLKKMLPAICFSGTFNKRNDAAILKHSGIICLDFDNYEKTKDMQEDKDKLSKDKYVYSVFVSPSGKGLKVLVKIPADVDNHIDYFNALEDYYSSPYFDKTCKNVSRVCYESYDRLIHINEGSILWDKKKDKEYVEVNVSSSYKSLPITDESKIIDILMKWWEKKYPMSEGQRNQNAYILAMALNEYGIAKSTASYILNQYSNDSFNLSEISSTIESAYRNTDKFNTKYYEDEEKLNYVKLKLRGGATKKEILEEINYGDNIIDMKDLESVIKKIDADNAIDKFWTKNDKGVIKVVPILFKQFLEKNGFNKYCPEGSKNYVFVKIKDNLIDHTSDKEIKDFVLEYLLQLEDMSIYNHFAEKVGLFREEFLTLLMTVDIHFISDTKDTSYLYYQNCAVKVTTKGIETIDYLELDGYVWKDHVIDRNFKMCRVTNCDYKTFISRISDNHQDRIDAIESTIGFMMHGHKNLSYTPAVILYDSKISDNPEGGTGKGIFMNALARMKKLVVIDGKAFNFEKSFPYQTVSVDTQILCFDDVKKNFDFERLFSVITEGLTLEKKNKDAIKIPYSKSPKIAITSNYAINGSGNSFARRKWEIEFHNHYSKSYTPYDEFKKHLFDDWDIDEWCQFDSYMVECLSSYMRTGLITSKFFSSDIRGLMQDTSIDFVDWCGVISGEENSLIIYDHRINLNALYHDYIENHPGTNNNNKVSRNLFYKWMQRFAKYVTGKDHKTDRDVYGKFMTIDTNK
jgi:hypothetical protein